MGGDAPGDPPDFGDGGDGPQFGLHVFGMPIGAVGWFLLPVVIQADLRHEHVVGDPRGRQQTQFFFDFALDFGDELLRGAAMHLQIRGQIEKGLVNRIDMEVFLGDEVEENGDHLRGGLDVITHPRGGVDHPRDVGEVFDAADVGDAVAFFEVRGRRHDDGIVGPRLIRDYQRRGENIQTTGGAFAARVERFQVDDRIDVFHRGAPF